MCGITGFAERNHKAETAARTAKATMWTTR